MVMLPINTIKSHFLFKLNNLYILCGVSNCLIVLCIYWANKYRPTNDNGPYPLTKNRLAPPNHPYVLWKTRKPIRILRCNLSDEFLTYMFSIGAIIIKTM